MASYTNFVGLCTALPEKAIFIKSVKIDPRLIIKKPYVKFFVLIIVIKLNGMIKFI